MEVFPDFSSLTPEEKWKSGRWSPGKDGGEEEEKLLFLRRKSIFQQLESVFGGVLLPSVVTSPYL